MVTAPRSLSSLHPATRDRDRQLQTQAVSRLRNSGYVALGGLDCHVSDGVVILSGVVPSYYLKQVAQAAILGLDEAQRVDNRVEVHYQRASA